MRKWLFAILMSAVVIAPAAAQDIELGAPQLVAQFPIDEPQAVAPSVLAPAYSNVTNFLGLAFANGGTALIGATETTRYVADDIALEPAAVGQPIVQITFSIANFDAAPVAARARVRFHLPDGGGGLPGSYIVGYTFNPIAFPSGVSLWTANIPAIIPPAQFWTGITFDKAGTASTAAQLNLLGQGLFDPPTVGSSADLAFQTSAASIGNVNFPPGASFNLGGQPRTNFGWVFTYDEPVPAGASTWGRVKAQYRN